jgi:eukaryotic-like serine/threonine-protein kinase
MGVIYRAMDMSLNREVAVKMLRDGFFADGKAIEKFRQESQLTASLAHPNVVRSLISAWKVRIASSW